MKLFCVCLVVMTSLVFFPGSNHLYVFVNPLKPDLPEGAPTEVDWEFAQKELAEQSGYATAQAGMTKGNIVFFFNCCSLRNFCVFIVFRLYTSFMTHNDISLIIFTSSPYTAESCSAVAAQYYRCDC